MARTKMLFLILALCLILVIIFMTAGYFQELGRKSTLTAQIDDVTHTLQLIPPPPEDLADRLEEARTENEAALRQVSGVDLDVTGIVNMLLDMAAEYDLNVNPVSTEKWTKRKIGTGTYDLLPLEMTINGDQRNFSLFLEDLETQELFPSLVTEGMTVTYLLTGGPETGIAVTVKLELSLVVRSETAG